MLLLPHTALSAPEREGVFPSLVSVSSCPLSLTALESVGLFSLLKEFLVEQNLPVLTPFGLPDLSRVIQDPGRTFVCSV